MHAIIYIFDFMDFMLFIIKFKKNFELHTQVGRVFIIRICTFKSLKAPKVNLVCVNVQLFSHNTLTVTFNM